MPAKRNWPFGVGTLVALAVVLGIAVIAFNNVNGTSRVAGPTPAPTPSPVTSASTSAVGQVAFADCSKVKFGTALAPLNPPAAVHAYSAAPALTIDTTKLYQATMHTAKGDIVLCLQPGLAPLTVNNFVTLARNHFFDGLIFHRVCPNSADSSCGGGIGIAQGGDPTGTGGGGPGYKFNDEPVRQKYVAGTIAMANSGANTNGSQFFIDTSDNSSVFQPAYNLFGNIETGLDVATALVKGDAMTTVTVAEQQ